LSFHEENIPSFLENFESIKERIRVPWKPFIRAYIRTKRTKVSFLHSYWDTEEDLENYRNLSFSMKFGLLQKNYSTANLRLGVWINCLLYLNVFILNLDNFKS
jgi:hypothetical protein